MKKKPVVIKEVINNRLTSYCDVDGEWETECDIDFVLEEPGKLKLFDDEIVIDRVKMYIQYWDVCLSFANESTVFDCFKVPKKFIHSVYKKVLNEQKQKDGFMEGYCFDDDLMEMLTAK